MYIMLVRQHQKYICLYLTCTNAKKVKYIHTRGILLRRRDKHMLLHRQVMYVLYTRRICFD